MQFWDLLATGLCKSFNKSEVKVMKVNFHLYPS